jgi:hypothetical protein
MSMRRGQTQITGALVPNYQSLDSAIDLVARIVAAAADLKNRATDQANAPVSWCCIFTQNEADYYDLVSLFSELGTLANDTKSGPVYVVPPIPTIAGPVRVVKVRRPDPTKPELGDADFRIEPYEPFWLKYQDVPGFKVIERDAFVMIELMEPGSNVRVYFSNPPVEEHDGIRQALQSYYGPIRTENS